MVLLFDVINLIPNVFDGGLFKCLCFRIDRVCFVPKPSPTVKVALLLAWDKLITQS